MYNLEVFTDQFEYVDFDFIDERQPLDMDYLAYSAFTVTTKLLDAKKGYFIRLTRNNEHVASGYIADVQPGKTTQEISIKPLQSLFDVEVYYTAVTDCITWLATNINAALMNNADTLQNRPITLTYTPSANPLPLTGFNLHKTVNLLSVMISALKTYGVVCEMSLDVTNKHILVNIAQQTATQVIEANLENVLQSSVTLGDSYGSTNKLIIRKTDKDSGNNLGETIFYLHPDGTIDTTNNNRIYPVFWELETLDTEDDQTAAQWLEKATARAKEVLEPAKYDNEIVLMYDVDDQIVHPADAQIGTDTTIYLDGNTYASILTGKKIEGQKITLTYGVVRTDLTKKLAIRQRETMTFENTVSAVMSNVAPNYVNNKTGIAPKARQLINYYPNTTRPTTADVPTTSETGLFTFLATTSMTTNKPSFGDGTIITMPWDTNAGWTAQLFVRNSADKMPCLGYRFQYGDATKPWTAWNMLPFYRVGDVVVTSTVNANLNSSFGGTWTLIDKEFKDQALSSSVITINTTNVSNIENFVIRLWGHSIYVRARIKTKVALDDTAHELLKIPVTNIGFTSSASLYNDWGSILLPSDGGNGVAICSFLNDSNTYKLVAQDVITKASNGTIAAGSVLEWNMHFGIGNINTVADSFCNKFFWQRTA